MSPLFSSFSLLYSSSSCVSVENSKLGPCRWQRRCGHVRSLQGASALASPALGPAHLDDGVHGAGLLAEAAIDALGHVDVVAGGPAAAVSPRLGLNGDGLGSGAGQCHLPATPGSGPAVQPSLLIPTPASAHACPLLGGSSSGGRQGRPHHPHSAQTRLS